MNAQITPELAALLAEIQAQSAARSAPGIEPGVRVHDAAAEAGAATRELAISIAGNVIDALKWGKRFTVAAVRGAPPKPRLTATQIAALRDAGLI